IMADAKRMAGDFEQSLELLDQAVENSAAVGERLWLSEISRIRGNVLSVCNDSEAAIENYRSALATANEQGAALFKLRAARDLASLWAKQSRAEAAHALLQPLYDQFTEGPETADLMECRELLDSLN
ncbi:MAG: hypothetical protein N2C12_15330, partial [Planctomycetales bacterium]